MSQFNVDETADINLCLAVLNQIARGIVNRQELGCAERMTRDMIILIYIMYKFSV